MRTTLRALAALAVLGIFGCGQKAPEPKPLPAPPSIKSFTADKTRITAGESVTLSFEAEIATSAVLVVQLGAKLSLDGTSSEGTATASPSATSFYVLTVIGDGGRTSAFVQVAVDEDLAEVFLVPVPSQVDSGEEVQLLWSAFNASSGSIAAGSGEQLSIEATQGSGIVTARPARSETYTLSATAASGTELTAEANVAVRPVLVDVGLTPPAANVGEDITFSWETRGAVEVTIQEKTFGELNKVSFPANEALVDNGTFTWTVPDQTPGQVQVLQGFPLEFTVAVKQSNPDVTLTRVFSTFVGDGPVVTSFEVPAAVTQGRPYEISWTTSNAHRVQVYANGALLYEPLARDQATVASGRLSLVAPNTATTFKLVAYSFTGASVAEVRQLDVVAEPVIDTFELPASVSAAGDGATATWTTRDATAVSIRAASGATVHATTDAASVASGTAQLFPGVRTTYVLEAWNAAGDVVTREETVDVNTPGTFSATPAPVTPGETVTVSWSLDSATVAQVFGDYAQPPVKNNPAVDFVDLSIHANAQELEFTEDNDAVSQIPVPAGFRLPFGGINPDRFFASTNGFVSFSRIGPRASNTALDSTGTLPPVIAPFWDDLVLGSGKVYTLVEGTAFPRRVIVQWDKVQTAVDPASELTFQVHLYETGEIRFAYGTLTGTDSAGESASIGWRLGGALNSEMATAGAPILSSGDEFSFFASGNLSGQYTATPGVPSVYTVVGKLASGAYVVYAGRVNVVAPGSVEINEVMAAPEGSAVAGQWVELFNTTDKAIDLSGVELASTATSTAFVFPEGTEIAAGGYLVVGASADPMQNGGAQVDVEWSTITPAAAADDTLALRAVTEIDSFAYAAAALVPGTSLIGPDRNVVDVDNDPVLCTTRSVTFGANGALGTPGARNESCFPFDFTVAASDYEDISAVGTALFKVGADDEVKLADLSAHPVSFFGNTYSKLMVDVNGNASFDLSMPSDYTNESDPDGALPNAMLSPFWDDLGLERNDSNIYIHYLPEDATRKGRWILAWHNVSHISGTDNFAFQVKLFDDGAVEYHYNQMISTSSSNYGDGNSATVWLAHPAAEVSWVIGYNDPVLQPRTSFRWTSRP